MSTKSAVVLILTVLGPVVESPESPSRLSDLYVAMKDVGLVELAAGGWVQKQSMAIGYRKARHHTLG